MDNQSISCIAQLHIKKFRCFDERIVSFDAPIILIQGSNGAGKTSILEALYYACYLRSFRASTPRELVADSADTFFIKLLVQGIDNQDEIHVGFSGDKRLVRVNQKAISSYKELMSYYRVIAITEDDLDLIKEGPSYRRDFLDHALMLADPSYTLASRAMRNTLEKRNALLHTGHCLRDLYDIWTQQLWDRSYQLQIKRVAFLDQLQQQVNLLIERYFEADFEVSLSYEPKKGSMSDSFALFVSNNPSLYTEELRLRRSLFGAHLDDILITFHGKHSRIFASRGQQKLMVILFKAAQIQLLSAQATPIILLLDDFMTDFDQQRVDVLIKLLRDLHIQLIFTTPMSGYFEQELQKQGAQIINLD